MRTSTLLLPIVALFVNSSVADQQGHPISASPQPTQWSNIFPLTTSSSSIAHGNLSCSTTYSNIPVFWPTTKTSTSDIPCTKTVSTTLFTTTTPAQGTITTTVTLNTTSTAPTTTSTVTATVTSVTSSTTITTTTTTSTSTSTTATTATTTIPTPAGFTPVESSLPGSSYSGSGGSSPVNKRSIGKRGTSKSGAGFGSSSGGNPPYSTNSTSNPHGPSLPLPSFVATVNCVTSVIAPTCVTSSVTIISTITAPTPSSATATSTSTVTFTSTPTTTTTTTSTAISTSTITDTATASASTTTTITSTVSTTTLYAACATNNFADTYQSTGFYDDQSYTGPNSYSNNLVSGPVDAYSCCVAAITTTGAQIWYWHPNDSHCHVFIDVGQTCSPTVDTWQATYGDAVNEITIGNGACGEWNSASE